MIPYFKNKTLCSVAHEIRYALISFLLFLKNYLTSMSCLQSLFDTTVIVVVT